MQKIRLVVAVAMITVLGACTALGLTTPQSPSQGLAYAYGTVASLRTSAAQAVTAGTITPAVAQQVLTLTDQARSYLDAGENLIAQGGSTDSVAADLALATNVLNQVSALLPKQ